ncbi:MAG: hypothetical protein ACPGU5_03390 [Lishizhenia sp.]
MNVKNITLLLSGVLLAFTACKKEDDAVSPIVPEPVVGAIQADGALLSNFFSVNNSTATQSFTIDATTPMSITGNKGTVIQFFGNSFQDASGNLVSGNIDVDLIEIYEKVDMLLLNKQTLGDNNGMLSPLISGGEFKITASQNGNDVSLIPGYNYNMMVQAPNGVDQNMQIFYQSSATADTLTWAQADSSLLFGTNGVYNGYFDSLGWVNCDYFMSQTGPQTSVSVDLPAGLNNTNCSVFISFDGLNSLTSIYNYSNGLFNTGSWYTLPVGLDVHFIALAFINNTPHVAIVPATITNNHLETITALTATTPSQLTTDIQNLP